MDKAARRCKPSPTRAGLRHAATLVFTFFLVNQDEALSQRRQLELLFEKDTADAYRVFDTMEHFLRQPEHLRGQLQVQLGDATQVFLSAVYHVFARVFAVMDKILFVLGTSGFRRCFLRFLRVKQTVLLSRP